MIECYIIMGFTCARLARKLPDSGYLLRGCQHLILGHHRCAHQSAPVAISRSCISGTSGNRSGLSNCVRPSSDSSVPLTESSASSDVDGSMGLPSLADR